MVSCHQPPPPPPALQLHPPNISPSLLPPSNRLTLILWDWGSQTTISNVTGRMPTYQSHLASIREFCHSLLNQVGYRRMGNAAGGRRKGTGGWGNEINCRETNFSPRQKLISGVRHCGLWSTKLMGFLLSPYRLCRNMHLLMGKNEFKFF